MPLLPALLGAEAAGAVAAAAVPAPPLAFPPALGAGSRFSPRSKGPASSPASRLGRVISCSAGRAAKPPRPLLLPLAAAAPPLLPPPPPPPSRAFIEGEASPLAPGAAAGGAAARAGVGVGAGGAAALATAAASSPLSLRGENTGMENFTLGEARGPPAAGGAPRGVLGGTRMAAVAVATAAATAAVAACTGALAAAATAAAFAAPLAGTLWSSPAANCRRSNSSSRRVCLSVERTSAGVGGGGRGKEGDEGKESGR